MLGSNGSSRSSAALRSRLLERLERFDGWNGY
jgi:hypothetical protein